MPWFPDFANAVELARLQTRASGHADPAAQYLAALNKGDTRALETVWPGEVVIYDPRAGEIRGHRRLRRFVRENQAWLAERNARVDTVSSTCVGGRAVVELVAHLAVDDGETAWPLAVVAESRDDWSVVFRTYCSQWPVDGRRHLRPAILAPGVTDTGGAVGRFRPHSMMVTSTPWWRHSPRMATTAGLSAPPIAAPVSCVHFSAATSAPAAGSPCSTAP